VGYSFSREEPEISQRLVDVVLPFIYFVGGRPRLPRLNIVEVFTLMMNRTAASPIRLSRILNEMKGGEIVLQ
jgi:hypothetical protein